MPKTKDSVANLYVSKRIRLGKNAKITSVAASGVESDVTLTELGRLDGVTPGTQVASKAVIADANVNIGTTKVTALHIGASGSETEVTATGAEINRSCDASARIVTTTATALALTVTQHAEKVVLINTNSTVANTFTLPVATGSGAKFHLINNIAQTQGTVVFAANGTTDVLVGTCCSYNTTAANAEAFRTTATSDKVTLNLTTTGGLGGDEFEAWDSAANTWTVRVKVIGSGTLATPFSQT